MIISPLRISSFMVVSTIKYWDVLIEMSKSLDDIMGHIFMEMDNNMICVLVFKHPRQSTITTCGLGKGGGQIAGFALLEESAQIG
jgi:hypothetical protein